MFVKKKEVVKWKKRCLRKGCKGNSTALANGSSLTECISARKFPFRSCRRWKCTLIFAYVEVDPNFLRVNGIGVMLPGKQREFRGEDCMKEAFEWLSTFLLDLATRFAAQEGAVLAGNAEYQERILKIIA